jgi:hypothetical protein
MLTKLSLQNSTSAILKKKGPPLDKYIIIQVWEDFKMLRTKIASIQNFFL